MSVGPARWPSRDRGVKWDEPHCGLLFRATSTSAPPHFRFRPAKHNGRMRWPSGSPDQAADSRAFGAAAYGFHNPQVAKAIVLQVPNRDASLIPHGTRRPN